MGVKLGGQVLVLTSRQVIATTDTKQDGFVLVDTEHAQASRCPGPGNSEFLAFQMLKECKMEAKDNKGSLYNSNL